MRPKPLTKHELRCSCNLKPLLAIYGRDKNGQAYVHVRVYKQNRVYAEVYSTNPIALLCRLCGRWWNIKIVNNEAKLEDRQKPNPL